MKERSGSRSFFLCAALAAALFFLCGCKRESIKVTTYHFERCGSVEFVCFCDDGTGGMEAASMERCASEEENKECYPTAFVIQVNRDEIGLVDLKKGVLIDSDVRVPFNTFAHTGRSPSDIAASADGRKIVVSHFGEDFAAVYETEDFLDDRLPEFTVVSLPGPSSSIASSKEGGKIYVTMPENSAIAVFDLEDPGAGTRIYEFPREGPSPTDEFEGEPTDAREDADAPEEGDVPPDVQDVDIATADDMDAEAEPDLWGEGPFHPWVAELWESEGGAFLVAGGSGSGGVFVMNASRLEEGIDRALVSRVLPGVPVGRVAVTPTGDFLYAIDRDEGTIHVVDMSTGQEVDTTGGNPLVEGGAMKLGGRAQDLVILELANGEGREPGPRVFNGVFAFTVASNGRLFVVDIEDRNCPEGEECPSHVVRTAGDYEKSTPTWRERPLLYRDDTQEQYLDVPPPEYPRFDRFDEKLPDGSSMWGVSFYPYDPWNDVMDPPDIRRAVTQQWRITYEGELPYSAGIGGNVEDGGVFTDEGMPLCAVGVRDGDFIVIEDPPSPKEDGTDCSAFPGDGEIEYRIAEARQYDLRLEVPAGKGYPLPSEDCFPFAVRYHVRASKEWIVVGSVTGYLSDWDIDEEGRCIDRQPPCGAWGEEGCTLKRGRAREGEEFANPYIKFILTPGTAATKPGTAYLLSAQSRFEPLGAAVAGLPLFLKHLQWNDSLYVSDGATEGLIEFDLDTFGVSREFF